MMPAPFSWPPSEYWDGDDGIWSSFAIRVGTPAQTVRVLPSTAGQATFVVNPLGCQTADGTTAYPNCTETRGGLFDTRKSQSWKTVGNYSLGLEQNLGYGETATYGLDCIAPGFAYANGGPTLQSQVVSDIITDEYFTGIFGIGHQPTNFTNQTDPHPSFLTTLRSENLIPSLSWAYTAGAKYRLKGVFGSLTLGGYDLSRFVPNSVSFPLAPDDSRDLVVGLQSIIATDANGSNTSLLPSGILTFIDSTLPYIYLPLEACQRFEDAFGLVWNSKENQYLVDDTQHQRLLAKNPTFTFSIGDLQSGGPTVDIVLPYNSFDLVGDYPLLLDQGRYFPLQRAANETQYTLGRTFLQEAYVITDYEHSNFSVSQCLWEDGLSTHIVTIPSATGASNSRLGHGVIIGASLGAIAHVLVVLLVTLAIRKWRAKKSKRQDSGTHSLKGEENSRVFSIQEIAHHSVCGTIRELPDSGKVELLDDKSPSGSDKEILELPEQPPPVYYELMANPTLYRADAAQKHGISDRSSAQRPTAIYFSTGIFTQSNTSFGRLTSPRVKKIVTSSPPLESPALNRPCLTKIRSSGRPSKLVDLHRPLPPTPISESPQVSPITAYSTQSRRGL